jgi:large subunit ribosomal protein L10
MHRADKEQAVVEIQEKFSGITAVVLADFRGLDVPTVTDMRDEFRKAGCQYRVLKNSLLRLAIKDSPLEAMSVLLAGPTAVMWSTESPSAAAKLAVKYAKDAKNFKVKGGFFDGRVLDAAGIEMLSKMPDKPECQANLLMTLIAAPQDMVRTLAAGPMNFLYLLQARERSLA